MNLPFGRVPAWLLCLIAGAGAALAFPPFGFLPGLLGFGLLLHLLDEGESARPLRQGFWRGWLAGTAYFLIGTWWVAEAFMVDAAEQGWMAPFAVLLLGGGLGLFWGLAGLAYRLARPRGLARVAVFAGVFAACEWLRGHVLTGFPWNLPGEAWRAGSAPSQMAALVGAYGLTWLTLLAAAAPGLLLRRRDRPALAATALAAVLVAGFYGYGLVRLGHAAPVPAGAAVIRIVQPDIPQESKYDAARFTDILSKYLALTRRPGAAKVDVVVWPEGAIPAAFGDYMAEDAWPRRAIQDALSPGQTLLVGAYRVAGPVDKPLYYNSLFAVRRGVADMTVTGVYDKFRLVPFGEYMPLDGVMSRIGFKKLVHVGDGFSTGPRPRPIFPAGAPGIQPLICYESLFPGFTQQGEKLAGRRPDLIVNVSNDAWFGATSGPWQHLNLASYRAIETGLPMARATPTGVSAMIDAYGRVAGDQKLKHGEAGVIDAALPPRLAPTPYARWGDGFFLIALGLSAVSNTRTRRARLSIQ